jgi:prepilin-type processing-associated H-X9-DG protein
MTRKSRRGFTGIELLVVVVTSTILLTLLIPAVSRALEQSRRTHCVNQLRNIALGLLQVAETKQRFPPSGSFLHNRNLSPMPHQTWAISVLPHVEQGNLFAMLDSTKPLTEPQNRQAAGQHVPVFLCPADISRSRKRTADLSYAVNGGVGWTARNTNGVRDCPFALDGTTIDLNGDGAACSGFPDNDNQDRRLFKMLGVFFLETTNTLVTRRHHTLGTIVDGTSNTLLITENARTGHDPGAILSGFAQPAPFYCAVYFGNPCRTSSCKSGSVDYRTSNTGIARINSGLWAPEGTSPVPNSFHAGGVNMAFIDGHVRFVSEIIDGTVYAALFSPQGQYLTGTPLEQAVISESF